MMNLEMLCFMTRETNDRQFNKELTFLLPVGTAPASRGSGPDDVSFGLVPRMGRGEGSGSMRRRFGKQVPKVREASAIGSGSKCTDEAEHQREIERFGRTGTSEWQNKRGRVKMIKSELATYYL